MHLEDSAFSFFFFLRHCRTRNVAYAHVGEFPRTWIPATWGPSWPCGRTIKFHFCRANVFELAIKQRFSPPSQRTTRPCRAAPRRWPLLVFCLLTNELVLRYTPSVLLFVFVALLHAVLSRRLREAQSYFGVRKYTRPVVCEGCQRAAVSGGTCNIIDKNQRDTKSRVYPVDNWQEKCIESCA